MAKAIDPQQSMAALFGSRVRRLRAAAGLTQAELGRMTHVVSTRITQIERASGAKPSQELAQALDAALVADELLVDLWPYVNREAFPEWVQAFMTLSARARAIRQYAAHVVPGLLQTEPYARALLSVGRTLKSDEQLEERLSARMSRQDRLRGANPPGLWVILDEAVLRRPVGGRDVMRDQLAHLLAMAGAPHITVQVLPFAHGEHDVLGGSLSVLDLPDGTEVGYTEGAHYGQLIEDPEEVRRFAVTYDHLRAAALPPHLSLDMIRSAMEDNHHDATVSSRSDRRRLAQKQLQQSGGRRLRRGGGRLPRSSPRP